jgi:UDP-N-acetylmuramate--alanine ligase
VARRFSVVDEPSGVILVDDYGHHPAEIRATLAAARRAFGGRVLVAFQPHRFTRTESLFDDFAQAFNDADEVLLADVYAAGEQPIAGADSSHLADAIRDHGHHSVAYVPDMAQMASRLAAAAKPGDIVLTLGAGDINKILKSVGSEIRGMEKEKR